MLRKEKEQKEDNSHMPYHCYAAAALAVVRRPVLTQQHYYISNSSIAY